MQDGACDNNLFPETSALKYRYNETEKGVNEMSEIIERLFREELDTAREEGRKEGKEEVALTMLNAGDPIERVSIRTGISVDDIFKLQHAQAVI